MQPLPEMDPKPTAEEALASEVRRYRPGATLRRWGVHYQITDGGGQDAPILGSRCGNEQAAWTSALLALRKGAKS